MINRTSGKERSRGTEAQYYYRDSIPHKCPSSLIRSNANISANAFAGEGGSSGEECL